MVASPAAVPTGAAGLAAVREAVEVQVAEVQAVGGVRATAVAGQVQPAKSRAAVAAMHLRGQSEESEISQAG